MKFSWKVFFSTLTLTAVTFSLGGYLLISSLFHQSLEREKKTAIEENELMRFSFLTAAAAVPGENSELSAGQISSISQALPVGNGEYRLGMRISGEDGSIYYQTAGLSVRQDLPLDIPVNTRITRIYLESDRYYIQTACVFAVQQNTLCMENFRDITSLFEERDVQYDIFQKLMLVLLVLDGMIIGLVSWWLTYPVKKLSRAARLIAGGHYEKRVDVHSGDEIGKLAQDFNLMADNLEERILQLKEAARRQEDFIGSFAHELKTPLTSIIGYSDMLRSKEMMPEDRFVAANYIFQEGKRLEALSLKLMELIVLNRQELPMRRVEITDLMESVAGVMYPVLEKEHIELNMAAEEAVLVLEPDLVKTLCINLIDNGRKAIDNGGRIFFRGRIAKDGYHILVKDTGRGMPKEELSRITEAFYMVDKSRARAKGGAGLGLAICSRIVELHCGKIRFRSVPDVGTLAEVILPLADQ
ncbi:sensor histidine kinase [Lachnotalea sp. AF33-28]|uniref:sensor histidine kinase n=1 Tax=Lachnotalea sp. AF33-28 TaxID=2292046 RepID=UPI000E475A11|nr:HAMP domain-containing sensor histidine kinase [Lachnotalea sp. AF33-28]RHP32824.1 sensor histidine kinase [Lachnotalea sp. AF33-28]